MTLSEGLALPENFGYTSSMTDFDMEIADVKWDSAPDSELRPRISPIMGRPRDKRFDECIERSVLEGPLRTEVPSRLASEITQGLKRGARFLGTGIKVEEFYKEDDDTMSVIEFMAWRKPESPEESEK